MINLNTGYGAYPEYFDQLSQPFPSPTGHQLQRFGCTNAKADFLYTYNWTGFMVACVASYLII